MENLSIVDREYAKKLREDCVLDSVASHRLDQKDGVIIITCSDGDQFWDIFMTHSKYVRRHRPDPRIHVIAVNGGAIAIPKGSPLNDKVRKDDVIIQDIIVASQLKGIKTVVLYAHVPCGAAGLYKLSLSSILELLVEAKERLKKELGDDFKIACFCHIDYGPRLHWLVKILHVKRIRLGKRKRTYFLSASDWRRWQGKYMPNIGFMYSN